MAVNYPAAVIPLPSYIMENVELTALHEKLFPFAFGDPDAGDGPCPRAQAACDAIEREMIKRGQPITFS